MNRDQEASSSTMRRAAASQRSSVSLVTAPHEAPGGALARLGERWSGTAVAPAEDSNRIVEDLVEVEIAFAMNVKDIQPGVRGTAQSEEIIGSTELAIALDRHDGR
jgi:hypothetical protein